MRLFHNDILVVKEEGPDLTELGVGDELCSDSFPYKIHNEVWYKFTLEQRTDKDTGDYDIGANASQEEAAESVDSSEQTDLNAVLNHQLERNMTMGSKGELKKFIKTFYPALKKATARKNPDLSPEELEKRINKYQDGFKEMLADFSNCDFFTGKNMNQLGTHLFVRWEGVTPYAYLPIDGITEVKY